MRRASDCKMGEDDINPTEQEALTKFKCLICENGFECPGRDDDQFLMRFLRARSLDLRKAAQMYGEYVQWRNDNSVATVLQTFDYPELDRVLEAWPQMWHKSDKMGRPVNIQLFSKMDIHSLFQATSEERLMKRAMWVWEDVHEVKLPTHSKASERYIGRVTVIVDLHNVGISTFTNVHVRRILQSMAYTFSHYYPEYLGCIIIVHAPITFKIVWQMLTPFMEEKTKKKIRIHRGNGLDDLLNTINEQDLPKFLGGRCQCGCHVG